MNILIINTNLNEDHKETIKKINKKYKTNFNINFEIKTNKKEYDYVFIYYKDYFKYERKIKDLNIKYKLQNLDEEYTGSTAIIELIYSLKQYI